VEPRSVREKEKEQPAAAGTRPQRATPAPPAVTPNGSQNGLTSNGVTSIAALEKARKARIEGRVSSVEIRPVENSCVFEATIADSTGTLTAMFYGRTHIPGFEPGVRLRLDGKVSIRGGGPAMINPAYELLAKDG
jgi:RecG-like helicase